jgi:hypothetical protein
MTDTPPDWVLIEAGKRSKWGDAYSLETLARIYGCGNSAYAPLCDMILKHEQPPVDRKLLCALKAMAGSLVYEPQHIENIAVRAIELYESGFGK